MPSPLNRLTTAVGAGLMLALASGAACPALAADNHAKLGYIEIDDAPTNRPGPFDWLQDDATPTLRQLVDGIEAAAERDDLDALVIRLRDAGLSQAQIYELGEAMAKVRASGKKVHVYSEAIGTGEIMLGAHADELVAQAGAPLSLPGLYSESWYLKDMLGWIGVTPDFVQVGDYKGADEALMRNEPSDAWNENIGQLLDSVYANLRGTIMTGRDLTDAELDHAMEQAWFADTDLGVELGLIDRVIDGSARENFEAMYSDGGEPDWDTRLIDASGGASFDPSNPFALFSILMESPSHEPTRETIAVLHIDAQIVDGDSVEGGAFGGSSVGSRTIRRISDELAEDDLIEGVVVRIDSPGGSATASEVIWKGLQKLAEKKPVWVSVGDLAASGGYYIAVAGDRIYVTPQSIVGSIGVVGGKLTMGDLYDKMNVNVVSRSRGPRADMFSSRSPWSEEERAMVRERMVETYEQFTDRVTQGREGIDLSKTAEGRLFTGDKALALNMADNIGSLDTAISDLASELGLGDFDVMDYPGPGSFEQLIEQAFGGFVRSPNAARAELAREAAPNIAAGMIEQIVGPRAWKQLRPSLEAVLQLRTQPVLLIDPRPTIIY